MWEDPLPQIVWMMYLMYMMEMLMVNMSMMLAQILKIPVGPVHPCQTYWEEHGEMVDSPGNWGNTQFHTWMSLGPQMMSPVTDRWQVAPTKSGHESGMTQVSGKTILLMLLCFDANQADSQSQAILWATWYYHDDILTGDLQDLWMVCVTTVVLGATAPTVVA